MSRPHPRPTNARLRRRFLYLNRRYFRSRLPHATMVQWKPMKNLMGLCMIDPPLIQLDTAIRPWSRVWELTLLHEMAHLSTGDTSHGRRWMREMMRLARAGAFNKLW